MPVEDLRKLIYAGNPRYSLPRRGGGKEDEIQFLDEDGLVLAEAGPALSERGWLA